ncbi:DUF3857 and transglutaminase domain-containing protein [Polynucleobacter sp. JS-Fieb-80-E5]|uniref:DUF3857 domain-containing protein n=1 Tax=Polynucleobacter sp. JS-Fieb-80-E5 TaxID=2081050 RepID=UPI001C0D8EB2|nr:DUF3857 and transglutaminase domain-containing protein [Polynucleobacter sp. JS-Fieb-80-E5]MBU3617629.1 DUF3857 and transglutaminase domain-containing protein [Polynucleobacter sp. JS-Fieb-80-E5]
MKAIIQSAVAVFIAFATLFGLAYVGVTSANNSDLEPLSAIERSIVNETIYPDGKVVEINELTKLVKSQLIVDSASSADLPFNSSTASLEVIEAYTITPQGKKISVQQSAIRTVEDDNSQGAAFFSDQKHKIIVFPNVTPGSKTYYKTKLTTFKSLLPGYFYTKFNFAPYVENQGFEYTLTYPEDLKLYVDTKGIGGGDEEVIGDGTKRMRFTYKNLKFAAKEQLEVGLDDYAPHIYISTFPSQAAFAKVYEAKIKDKVKVTPQVQKLADEITKGIKPSKDGEAKAAIEAEKDFKQQQARAIYNWVSRNIRYVGIYLDDGSITPHDANSIIDNRYGDCKDHNALLIALLAAKGIKASSALINAGSSFTVPKYPVVGPFNHVITYIPAWDQYLDSTAEMAPYGLLPEDEVHKPTLITDLGKIGRTHKPDMDLNRTITGMVMTIQKDGRIKGEAHSMYFGSAEIAARYKYEGLNTTLSEKIASTQLAKFRQTGEGKLKSTSVYNLDEPLTTDSKFTLDAVSNFPGPGAMTVPVGLAPGELATIANDRPPEAFKRPYRCATKLVNEAYLITFPSNVKVTHIPAETHYKKGYIQYDASYALDGSTVSVKRRLMVERPSAVCQPQELQKWKDFYQVFIKDMRGQIFYE